MDKTSNIGAALWLRLRLGLGLELGLAYMALMDKEIFSVLLQMSTAKRLRNDGSTSVLKPKVHKFAASFNGYRSIFICLSMLKSALTRSIFVEAIQTIYKLVTELNRATEHLCTCVILLGYYGLTVSRWRACVRMGVGCKRNGCISCDNGLCLLPYQRCDGLVDCTDFSDEQRCRTHAHLIYSASFVSD